jgi:hypothetical protein
LARLVHLDLAANQIGDAGAQALVESGALEELRWRSLQDNGITNAGGRVLTKSAHLGKFALLRLGKNRITGRMKEQLRERFGAGVVL